MKNISKLDNQDSYWNKKAWEKTFTHPLNISLFRTLVPEHGNILDYECGYGRICHELSCYYSTF
ncbi:MAG: hypothetical protein GY749_39975 [Desulfobacteraceae bacterium]|nr:hypothetical protein [Desulfobacteraceae bacterium]